LAISLEDLKMKEFFQAVLEWLMKNGKPSILVALGLIGLGVVELPRWVHKDFGYDAAIMPIKGYFYLCGYVLVVFGTALLCGAFLGRAYITCSLWRCSWNPERKLTRLSPQEKAFLADYVKYNLTCQPTSGNGIGELLVRKGILYRLRLLPDEDGNQVLFLSKWVADALRTMPVIRSEILKHLEAPQDTTI
jgi:hypothetical protein